MYPSATFIRRAGKIQVENDVVPGAGTLYVVATPIGNLEDLTLRAIRVLREADVVACEDTRHTRKLLAHLGLSTRLKSYYRERERQRSTEFLEELRTGHDVALVSDAGTPGICDPGALLVAAARAEGIRVEAIAGPSAMAAALSVAGFEDDGFVFLGFPPAKQGERRRLLESVAALAWPLALYVAPHKLSSLLDDCLDLLGDRDCVFCRELTKLHEESVATTLAALGERARKGAIKGEIVLLIRPAPRGREPGADELDPLLAGLRDQGLSLRDGVRRACAATGAARSVVYPRALAVWKDSGNNETGWDTFPCPGNLPRHRSPL